MLMRWVATLGAAGCGLLHPSRFAFQASDEQPALKAKPRVVVVGGGVMGAAAAYSLVQRGDVSVTMIEAGNPFNSSWGESRIARLSQDTPLYLRMMQRSRALWAALEAESSKQLFKPTGMLDIGQRSELTAVVQSYDACRIPYEELSSREVADRWPGLDLGTGQRAVFQKDGWLVLAAEALEALTAGIMRRGATVRGNEVVVCVDRVNKTVITESGTTYAYDKLILCGGPWTNQLLIRAELAQLPLVVSNEQQTYFATEAAHEHAYDWDHLPVIIDRGPELVYVLPHVVGGANGVKVSTYRCGPALDTDEHRLPVGWRENPRIGGNPSKGLMRQVATEMGAELDVNAAAVCSAWAQEHMPWLKHQAPDHHYRCMYTTPVNDHLFVVGSHPEDSDVFLACAGCGQGFKFGMVIGEAVANMALGQQEEVAGMRATFSPSRDTLQSTPR